ncbi:MAG: hypothetical protein LBP21_03135 [Synergistaceae bacterium]|nr:hypothetical protein [Synergistaceae bacterium]
MSVSSVSSNSSILNDEYLLEQQRKLHQQKQKQAGIDSDDGKGMNAAKTAIPQSDDNSASRPNMETSGQSTSASKISGNTAYVNVGSLSSTGTNGATVSNQSLITKANSGVELSVSELQTLKQIDPALYARVVAAQKASGEARTQLSGNSSVNVQMYETRA